MEPTLRRALVGTMLVALAAIAGFALFPSGRIWEGLSPAHCAEYCEHSTRCGPLATRASVQQPLNTWSNLGFLLVGALAIARARDVGGLVFGAACGVLATGSFLFHAAVTLEFQWLDVVGMYFAIAAVAARSVHDAGRIGWRIVLPAYAAVCVFLAAFKWMLPTTAMLVALGAIAAAGLVTLAREGRTTLRAGWVPLALIALAYVVRESDVRRWLCWPDSVVYQGHALWHLLSAASLHAAWIGFERAQPATSAVRSQTPRGGV
jgi:uncharacterized membrane protein YhaH (DUF805 family)